MSMSRSVTPSHLAITPFAINDLNASPRPLRGQRLGAVLADHRTVPPSPYPLQEIADAPEPVRELFDEMLPNAVIADVSEEALQLRDAYISAQILSPRWKDDALHIALATTNECSLIVSWNFKHIVNFQKIPLYNAVNVLQGYDHIDIYSPLEVAIHEDQEEDI